VDGGYFQGDSLQIGIDPCLRREDTYGAIAVYIFALSPAGPRMVRWLSPDSDYVPGFRSPPMYSNLGEASREFLTAEPWEHGRAYTLRIPWREMLVDPPAAGDRLGLFLAFHNNNGQGVLDTLHWPQPIPGMFTVPRKWGVVTLLPA